MRRNCLVGPHTTATLPLLQGTACSTWSAANHTGPTFRTGTSSALLSRATRFSLWEEVGSDLHKEPTACSHGKLEPMLPSPSLVKLHQSGPYGAKSREKKALPRSVLQNCKRITCHIVTFWEIILKSSLDVWCFMLKFDQATKGKEVSFRMLLPALMAVQQTTWASWTARCKALLRSWEPHRRHWWAVHVTGVVSEISPELGTPEENWAAGLSQTKNTLKNTLK